MHGSRAVRLRANAKLNLFLRVVGRRPDGYHDLESVFHSVALADTLTATPLPSKRIEVDTLLDPGLRGELPDPDENLVAEAARALADRGGIEARVRIEILKRIPIGAGLGGGSADAAGTLVALKDLWDLDLDQAELARIAGSIGSDVPFCLSGGTSLAMERGGDLTPLPAPASMWFVLGMSFEPLSTQTVYERWDAAGGSAAAGSAPMALALGAGDVGGVAALVHNDLEEPALTLRPALRGKKDSLRAAGALGAGMSGSGPTMFGIAEDEDHARAVAGRVAGEFDRVVCVPSAPRGIEAVA